MTTGIFKLTSKATLGIGEVSDLCQVKPHVLRYWEQEFPQLHPIKRRGNRRYYQREDVMVIRQIRELLYDKGFTIGGARQQLEAEEQQDSGVNSQNVQLLISELEDIIRLLKN